MRCVPVLTVLLLILQSFVLHAEDADEVREKGIAALKDSQTNPHAIVEAARLFVKAAALYGDAGNEEQNVEMNSFLYWCKKKMTLEDIEQFTKGGEAAVTSKLAAVEKAAPKADEAQKWFDRAEQFAKKKPGEHLLIAIRFYEVADRFKGSDAGLMALDRSLKEQLQDKSSAVKTVAQPTTIKPTETVANDVGKRPVPLENDLKTAEKLIKDLLKADYAKTDAPSRLALIAKLLQQADENKNDAALVYVCLHEARDLAVLAGDVIKAAEVQVRLSDAFKSDFAAILLDLKRLESSAKTAEPATALAALFAFEADMALAEADYDQAVRFYSRAEDLLPLSKDAALKARLKTEIPRVQAIKRESVAALAAQKTLATKPDDAEANLSAGKFALLLGEVEKSMALLAKSKDGVLSALAMRELAPPQEAAAQTLLADGWFDRAEKEGLAYLKTRMQERAALWYATALPGLTGVAKLKVDARMKTLSGSLIEPMPPIKIGTPAKPFTPLAPAVPPPGTAAEFAAVGSWIKNEGNISRAWILGADHSISGGDGAGGTWEVNGKVLILKFAKYHGTHHFPIIDENTFSEGKDIFHRVIPKEVTPAAVVEKPPASSGKEFVLDLGSGVKLELIAIPAGKFVMGSPATEAERHENEGPQHEVTISQPFYMGKYDVTQEQYEALIGRNPSDFKGPKKPAENVSWDDAKEFCRKLSQKSGKTVRLPTEAEWEYACRAGTTTPFYFGETIRPDQVNYDGNFPYGNAAKGLHRKKTTDVGGFQPNRFGLYDLHGNVWQWCEDWYDEKYYSNTPPTDPAGPAQGEKRILRGGCWDHSATFCRSACRYFTKPGTHSFNVGFRVVVAASNPEGTSPTAIGKEAEVQSLLGTYKSAGDGLWRVSNVDGVVVLSRKEWHSVETFKIDGNYLFHWTNGDDAMWLEHRQNEWYLSCYSRYFSNPNAPKVKPAGKPIFTEKFIPQK